MKSLFVAAVISVSLMLAVIGIATGIEASDDGRAHAERDPALAEPAALMTGDWEFAMEIIEGIIHGEFIGMPIDLVAVLLLVGILDDGSAAIQGDGIAMSVDGDPPFVDVEGFAQPDGSFMLEGMGTVAGFPNVSVTFEGTIEFPGVLEGTYTMGANGELPGGEPAVYDVDGVKVEQVTPTPTPAPSPTPTQAPGQDGLWADNDCDEDNDAVDALISLQKNAGLPYNQNDPCPELEEMVGIALAGAVQRLWGDLDCDGDVDAVDALKQLQNQAAIPFNQEPGCPEVGQAIMIQ
jgi:hypothetical protein